VFVRVAVGHRQVGTFTGGTSRYDADELHGEFGSPFEKVVSCEEVHHTP